MPKMGDGNPRTDPFLLGYRERRRAKPSYEDLHSAVVENGMCSGCGACEASCPVDIIRVEEVSTVTDIDECLECGICSENCHRFDFDWKVTDGSIVGNRDLLTGDETAAGRVIEKYYGKATDPGIEDAAQNGGVVTALLKYLFENGEIDSALVVGQSDEPWEAETRVITSVEEAEDSAGSKYTYDSVLTRLEDATDLGRAAVVALPCQAQGVANMKVGRLRRGMKANIGPVIAIFCMETFEYGPMEEFVKEEFGLDLNEVDKMDISSGNFKCFVDGQLHEIDVKECDPLIREGCHSCLDLTAEYADVSVGNLGSPGEHSTVLTRTELGEEVYGDAVESGEIEGGTLDEVKPGFGLVEKISRVKLNKNSPTRGSKEKRQLKS